MWNRTVKIKIKSQVIDVLIFLNVNKDTEEAIFFRSMINEYFLQFEIVIDDDRDLAHSLIKNFPVETIRMKMEKIAIENGAL